MEVRVELRWWSLQVDVAAVSKAAAEAAARMSGAEPVHAPRMTAAQSSPNLQGLYIRNGTNGVLRARSVELGTGDQVPTVDIYRPKGIYTGAH